MSKKEKNLEPISADVFFYYDPNGNLRGCYRYHLLGYEDELYALDFSTIPEAIASGVLDGEIALCAVKQIQAEKYRWFLADDTGKCTRLTKENVFEGNSLQFYL